MAKNQFNIDFQEAKTKYSELEYALINNHRYKYRVDGILKIVDSKDSLWGVFRVSLYFKANYPFGFGILQETSNVIPRHIDRHIDKHGICCICGPVVAAKNELKPISILKFIEEHAIPYLANQIHYDEFGYFKNGEYSHYEKGLWESFEEEFKTKDPEIIKSYLNFIRSKPSVNTTCYCGSVSIPE